MTRDELIERIHQEFGTLITLFGDYLEEPTEKIAHFILANWKEFIPEGYKKYEGKLFLYAESGNCCTFEIDGIDIFSEDVENKQAILIIKDGPQKNLETE